MFHTTKKTKTDEEIHIDAWKAMHRHDWLFPQNFETIDPKTKEEITGPATSDEYLSYFARKERLFLFRCPSAYKFPLVEKLKEKIAFSSHLMQGQVIIPYTVFQLNGTKMHAIADWVWDKDKAEFVFPMTLFITDQREYIKFLDEHVGDECEFQQETLGFGGVRNG